MSERVNTKFGTLCVHAGNEPDFSTGAVVPPISLATTFAQSGLGNLYGKENLNSHGIL
jgi:cystathionine beta-lyase/cystathionine gamma-synthase